MIAAWMGYLLAASALLGVGTLVADRVRRVARRPLRWVWVIGMAACMVAPLLASGARRVWRAEPASAPAAATQAGSSIAGRRVPPTGQAAATPALAEPSPLAAWDTPLLVGWALASMAIAAVLLVAAARLHRLRRTWRRAVVHGCPVLVSPSVGPAVAGFIRQDIVIPEWALRAPEQQQRLMLLHEREHVRAHDPVLLLAALAAVVLMPWNLVLWWLGRRLRLAVELDCDARVLREMPDISAYGALLIEVGRRGASRRVVPLAALSDRPTFLERRIRMLSLCRPRNTIMSALAIVCLSAMSAGAATLVPEPAALRPTLVVPWRSHGAANDSLAPEVLRAMQTSLRNMMVSQEAYFADHGRYAPDDETLAAAGFVPRAGVATRLAWAGANAYVVEVTAKEAAGATCIVHVGWIPRSVWPATRLERKTGSDGQIVCDGDGREAQAVWLDQVREFMADGLEALVLPQERARGATGTYPSESSQIRGNRWDPALHFSYIWADTASWGAKAVYDSIPGKSCVVWAGSPRARQFVLTDAQHHIAHRGKVACDDF